MRKLLIVFFTFVIISGQNSTYAVTSFKKGAGNAVWLEAAEFCGSNVACQQNYWNKVKELGVTWLYNWSGWQGDHKPTWMTDNSVEFVPMIGDKGSETDGRYTAYELSRFANYAGKNPGSHWLIWNEPDLAGLYANTAALIYDPLRNAIKNADPTAKLIVGGIWSNNTRWLNDFREAYKSTHNGVYPVVEGWAGHYYRNESTYEKQLWRTDFYDFRNWMVQIGDCDATTCSKEFWLSEFGDLDEYNVGMTIMADQLGWLEEPNQSWVTRYAWFFVGMYGGGATTEQQGNLFSNSVKDMTVDLSTQGVWYASNPGPPPVFHGCYYCELEANVCPNGTLYDKLGSCGPGFRCCSNRITPTPTLTPTPIPTVSVCLNDDRGNLNCDSLGTVDMMDLNLLLGSWSPDSAAPIPAAGQHTADIDADGHVNMGDLTKLLSNWTT